MNNQTGQGEPSPALPPRALTPAEKARVVAARVLMALYVGLGLLQMAPGILTILFGFIVALGSLDTGGLAFLKALLMFLPMPMLLSGCAVCVAAFVTAVKRPSPALLLGAAVIQGLVLLVIQDRDVQYFYRGVSPLLGIGALACVLVAALVLPRRANPANEKQESETQ